MAVSAEARALTIACDLVGLLVAHAYADMPMIPGSWQHRTASVHLRAALVYRELRRRLWSSLPRPKDSHFWVKTLRDGEKRSFVAPQERSMFDSLQSRFANLRLNCVHLPCQPDPCTSRQGVGRERHLRRGSACADHLTATESARRA